MDAGAVERRRGSSGRSAAPAAGSWRRWEGGVEAALIGVDIALLALVALVLVVLARHDRRT